VCDAGGEFADRGQALGLRGRGGVAARLLFSIYEFEVRYSLYVEPRAAEISEVALGRWDFGIHLLEAPGGQVRVHGGFLHWGDAVGVHEAKSV